MWVSAAHAEFIVEIDSSTSVDAARTDGTIAMDLLGSLWTIAPTGGQAQRFTDGLNPIIQPRWSPDGTQILYLQRNASNSQIWRLTLATGDKSLLVDSTSHIQNATWHPSGERLLYVTDTTESGLDVWEADVETGLRWRLSNHVGDETHPVWSASGRHLAYVHRHDTQYRLILRRHGEPERVLLESESTLAAPSWRPDGSLLTYFQRDESDGNWALNMAILSSPPLLRPVSADEALSPQNVSWPDRMRMVYTTNQQIMTKDFADRRGRPVHFRALINPEPERPPRVTATRDLEIMNAPEGALVIRGARIFDGISDGYRSARDILVENGLIVAVEPRREWLDATVLDLGDVTIMPGLIDSWSALPDPLHAATGAEILAYGVTTIVSPDVAESFDASIWEGDDTPGPRLLPAITLTRTDMNTDVNAFYLVNAEFVDADQSKATEVVANWHDQGIPVITSQWPAKSALGIDVIVGANSYVENRARTNSVVTLLSVLADAATPQLADLLQSRQAQTLGHSMMPPRRIGAMPMLATSPIVVVAGSRGNHLPAGLGLHAELRALSFAGRSGAQALHSVGRNASQLLGLQQKIGVISPGAVADLLLINGDPLNNSDDALNIVAVVRNGRFFSLVRLLDQAREEATVE